MVDIIVVKLWSQKRQACHLKVHVFTIGNAWQYNSTFHRDASITLGFFEIDKYFEFTSKVQKFDNYNSLHVYVWKCIHVILYLPRSHGPFTNVVTFSWKLLLRITKKLWLLWTHNAVSDVAMALNWLTTKTLNWITTSLVCLKIIIVN